MKYIRIKNNGLIEPQALHLVGASTKRADNTKIGSFGSGNKYALAFLLRNNYQVKVFAGLQEIKLSTLQETFREQHFDVIYINGERTSITTEMGKDWKLWQALREIYCNSLDEGGSSIDFVQEIIPADSETHFYILNEKGIMEFIADFDNCFATKKKVLFECQYGRILEKSGDKANIYRKGIRCFDTNKTSVFDYDFTEITIDENRLIRYFWQVEETVWNLIYQCDNEEVIMQILHNCANTDFLEGCISEVSTINASNVSETFKECLQKSRFAPLGYAGLLKPDEANNHIIVPTKVYNAVRGFLSDANVGDRFKVSRQGGMFREIETSPLWDASIKQAMYFLSEAQFDIPYEIVVAIFDDKDILGCAYDGKIILSDICCEQGVNTIVTTILEEYIHLKYEVMDETRAFQTAMLTEFVSYMKKVNSFVI